MKHSSVTKSKKRKIILRNRKKEVLFVCHGNVGRSQMAEAFYNHLTKSNSASSAGTDHTTPGKYSRPTKEVVEAMSEVGIDVSKKKVKMITKEMLTENDKVFVMCPRGKCPSFLSKSSKVKFWRIKDPYGKGKKTTRDVRDAIKKKILGILDRRFF